MRIDTGETWLDEFLTSDAVRRAGTRGAFYRALRDGRFITLARGVHLPTHVWGRLDVDAQFRARVHAAARADGHDLAFSHLSAAALWRLPMVGAWPAHAEVSIDAAGGGVRRSSFKVHTIGRPATTDLIDGVAVTTLTRSVLDVAGTAPLGTAVTMADAALSADAGRSRARAGTVTTIETLAAELATMALRAGRAKCHRVLELADGGSGSPGESVSRVAMHLQGLPMPSLQKPFYDRRGLIGVVDFWWPDFSLIGEFDGRGKYTREDMLKGRSPAEAVLAEKAREDRLRSLGPRVVRWGWEAAVSPPRLARVLRDAGLR